MYEINVLINIALLYEATQRYQEAIEQMNSALKLNPDNQKIKQKIRQLTEMLNSRLQGS